MAFHVTNNNKYNCRAYQQQQQQNRWHHPLSPGLDSPLSSRSSSSRSYSFDNSSNASRHRRCYRPPNRGLPPLSQYVALDCEMVGTTRLQQAAAHVVMVNWEGDKIYDEYVKPDHFVTDYRTFVSGVTAQDLEKYGRPLAEVRNEICALINGKILVGHALGNDLKCLDIKHPSHLQRDTAHFGPFMQEVRGEDGSIFMQPRKLRHLASKILQREIQVPGKAHCPTEDAIAAMDLFKSQRHRWEKWVLKQQQEEISRSQQSQQQEISKSQQLQQWQRQEISKSQQLQQLQMQSEQQQYIQQRFVQEIWRSWQLQELQMQFEQQRYLQQQFFRHHHPQRHKQSIRHHHPQRLQKHPSLT